MILYVLKSFTVWSKLKLSSISEKSEDIDEPNLKAYTNKVINNQLVYHLQTAQRLSAPARSTQEIIPLYHIQK